MKQSSTKWVNRICVVCGSRFRFRVCWIRNERSGIYCSRKCQAVGRPKNKSNKIVLSCEVCGNEFSVKPYRGNTARFCSIRCMSVWRGRILRGPFSPRWKGGVSKRTYSSRRIIRAAITEIGRCQRCGATTNLHGHHIVPWKDNRELREDRNSIMVLCRECHSSVHPELGFLL